MWNNSRAAYNNYGPRIDPRDEYCHTAMPTAEGAITAFAVAKLGEKVVPRRFWMELPSDCRFGDDRTCAVDLMIGPSERGLFICASAKSSGNLSVTAYNHRMALGLTWLFYGSMILRTIPLSCTSVVQQAV